MIESYVLCGRTKPSDVDLALCCECRFRTFSLMRDTSEELDDRLWSQEIAEAAIATLEEYDIGGPWGVVLDYLRLILAGLKSEADLLGVLVKETKLKPAKAKALADEILTLYFR